VATPFLSFNFKSLYSLLQLYSFSEGNEIRKVLHAALKAKATQFSTGNDYGSAYSLCSFYEALSDFHDCYFKEILNHYAAVKND
jgi:hypothetical protein